MEQSPEEAWRHFRGWRVNPEAAAYLLADRLVAVPWSGERRSLRLRADQPGGAGPSAPPQPPTTRGTALEAWSRRGPSRRPSGPSRPIRGF